MPTSSPDRCLECDSRARCGCGEDARHEEQQQFDRDLAADEARVFARQQYIIGSALGVALCEGENDIIAAVLKAGAK